MTRMKSLMAATLTVTGMVAIATPAAAQSTEEVLGAVIGGTAGTWIGKELDNKGSSREGQIIGAVVGGSLGYIIGDRIDDRNDARRYQTRRVYSQPRTVYSSPTYSRPVYTAPRYVQPTYVAPRRVVTRSYAPQRRVVHQPRHVTHYPQGRVVYVAPY